MVGTFLEEIGAVKTARREEESLLLARAALGNKPIRTQGSDRLVKLAKHNKVLLRVAPQLGLASVVEEARVEVEEAFRLYDLMSKTLESRGIRFVVIKSFDSLPDMGHDLDFLIASPEDFAKARDILLRDFHCRPQVLTHCDKLLGKFSCFLPGYVHDFEIYPAVSQLGEQHLNQLEISRERRKELIRGREIWLTSDIDRVLIRVIHAMYRHNFLKLSDILDFLTLVEKCPRQELLRKVHEAGIGDSFLFLLATVSRFLKTCDYDSSELAHLAEEAEKELGSDPLQWVARDRLVLPYRIPVTAIVLLFLLKAGRDLSRGLLKSALLCSVTPMLIVLDFVNAVFNHRLFRRRIW